jgi:large subunit ribosomal protein L13
MRTFSPRPTDIERRWLLVDAEGVPLGRLATQVAMVLRGKHKPIYSPHMDTGDHVVVINADKVLLTGRKPEQKCYFRHSMYPGGLKWTSFSEMRTTKPERVVLLAVKGMLPGNTLGRSMLRKLKVYAGAEHPHAAQKPEVWAPRHAPRRQELAT